jgi:DNA invertase Pin-like site-specific DNA recombinase
MLIGYARTSTREQAAGLAAQERELEAAGCDQIVVEQVSSVGERPQLDAVLTLARKGDAIVVTKLDRFARSVQHLWELIQRIEGKGATLRILSFDGGSLDTGSAQGRLMLNVLGAVAQFERELMLERQREGIAKAKAEGKYKGRAPTARAKAAQVRELAAAGVGKAEIARRLAIGERSVYRILDAGLA